MLARRLDDRRWLVVFLDGFGMGEHLLVGALGVANDGTKGVLFVIDGGKALERAIRSVFGAKAQIQRCRQHKERNVLEHLPEAERPLVQRPPLLARGGWPASTRTSTPSPSRSLTSAAACTAWPASPPASRGWPRHLIWLIRLIDGLMAEMWTYQQNQPSR